jgi:hypothetical protein
MNSSRVKVEVTFVPHGLEADFSIGKGEFHYIRDFGTDQDPKKLAADFVIEFSDFIDKFKKAHDK